MSPCLPGSIQWLLQWGQMVLYYNFFPFFFCGRFALPKDHFLFVFLTGTFAECAREAMDINMIPDNVLLEKILAPLHRKLLGKTNRL